MGKRQVLWEDDEQQVPGLAPPIPTKPIMLFSLSPTASEQEPAPIVN
jgi:hypothetical protein